MALALIHLRLFISNSKKGDLHQMKEKIAVILKFIIFVTIFGLLLQRISLVLQVYGKEPEDPDRRACLFFSLPDHTVDVLFTGTSHVYCSYIPKQIYDETGITSAVLATSSQSYQNTYWLLKEALQHQQPKLVVLDIHSITSSVDETVQNFRLHYTSGISSLPDLSVNKIFAYRDITSNRTGWAKDMTIYDAYGFLEYKNEYDRGSSDPVTIANLMINPVSEYRTFGYYPTDTIYPMTRLKPCITSTKWTDLEETDDFRQLQRITELLQDQDIPLLLVRAPYHTDTLDDHQLYSQVFKWADGQNIPVIDFFELIDETGINLKTDFRDLDHLNYLGSQKITKYMETYLQKNDSLISHKGDNKYTLWERTDFDYQAVENRIQENIKK